MIQQSQDIYFHAMRKSIFLTVALLSVALSACRQGKTNALHEWENYQEMAGTPLGGDSLYPCSRLFIEMSPDESGLIFLGISVIRSGK